MAGDDLIRTYARECFSHPMFVAFYLAPVCYAIYLSLFIRKRVGIGPAREIFGGLANYVRAVQDGDFLNGLKEPADG